MTRENAEEWVREWNDPNHPHVEVMPVGNAILATSPQESHKLAEELERFQSVTVSQFVELGRWTIKNRAAILAALRSSEQTSDAPPGLLMSIAMRLDHGLACPGYYDQPMYAGSGVTHAQRLRVALADARRVWEEVTGRGFYKPDREAEYVAIAASGGAKGDGK
jgi:hypothetical protein